MQIAPIKLTVLDQGFQVSTAALKITIVINDIPREDFQAVTDEAMAALQAAFAGVVDHSLGDQE